MAKHCIQCNQSLRKQAKFCPHCGTSQPQEAPPTTPHAAQEESRPSICENKAELSLSPNPDGEKVTPSNESNASEENQIVAITKGEPIPLHYLPTATSDIRTEVRPETELKVLARDDKLNWLNVEYESELGETIFGWVEVKGIEMFLRQRQLFEQIMDLKITEYEYNGPDDFKQMAERLESKRQEVARQKSTVGMAVAVALMLFLGGLAIMFVEIVSGILLLLFAIGLFIHDIQRVRSINRPLNEQMRQFSEERRYWKALEEEKRRQKRYFIGNWFEDSKKTAESAAKNMVKGAAVAGTIWATIKAAQANRVKSEEKKQKQHELKMQRERQQHELNLERARSEKNINVSHRNRDHWD